MGRRRDRDPEELAARLLRQPERAAIDELLDAIRGVNPTGQELPATEQRRRYRLKAALQSLLLRRFGDDVAIIREPDQHGIVLLRHRYADHGGAAHAIIADLDEDARSIVWRRVDEGERDEEPIAGEPARSARALPARAAPKRSDRDAAVDDLVQRADAAREDYDYEAARELYLAAFAASGGALAAAMPLVELLVESVADNDAALALVPRLATSATEDASLSAKLALAAARTGNRVEMESWLYGVHPEASVAAWMALTNRAISDARIDDAAAYAKSAREAGAMVADLVRLEGEIETLRRKRWSAADSDLESLLAAGDFTRAEPSAAEILAHWSEAPVARRVMLLAKDRRRGAERDHLIAEASAALARGDTAVAADRSTASRLLGGDTTALEAAIAATVEASRRQRERQQVERVVARLANVGSREALLAYVDMPMELRADVRREVRRDALAWLDQLGSLSGARSAAAAVSAVMALEALTSDDDPDAIIAALTPHEAVLHSVHVARERLANARSSLVARRRVAAEEQLAGATTSLDKDEINRAKTALSSVDKGALNEAGRERLRTAQARLDEARELVSRRASVERRIAEGDLLGALRAIEWLCEIADEAERVRWSARAAELADGAKQQWPVYQLAVAGAPISDQPHLGAEIACESPSPTVWYVLDGEEVVVASSHSRWLFIYSIDVGTRSLVRALVVPLPVQLGKREVTAFQRHVWIVGTNRVIEFDLEAVCVRAWRHFRDVLPDAHNVTSTHVLPDAGFLWARIDDSRAIVSDLKRWEYRREAKVGHSIARFLGGRDPQIASFNMNGSFDIHEAGGAYRERVEIAGYQINALCHHPAGSGRRVAVISRMTDNENDPLPLSLAEVGQRTRRLVPGAVGTRPHVLLTLPAAGVALVVFTHDNGDTTRIQAFDTSGDLAPLWNVEAAHQLLVAEDIHARRAVALYPTDSGLSVDELSERPPSFHGGTATTGRLPQLAAPFDCKGVALDPAAASAASGRWSRHMKSIIGMIYASNVDAICALFAEPEADPELLASFDRDLFIELQKAEQDARGEAWERVVERLEGLAIHVPGPRPHRLHLLGTARLRLGDHEGALRAFREARILGGDGCRIAECVEWVEALAKPLPAQVGSDNPSQRMLRALRAADASFASGNPDGARRALERPAILAAGERQSLARLAVSHLATPPRDDLGRAHKAQALARFCDWMDPGVFPASRTEVFLPNATWNAERLTAVNGDAKAWLDENFPPGNFTALADSG